MNMKKVRQLICNTCNLMIVINGQASMIGIVVNCRHIIDSVCTVFAKSSIFIKITIIRRLTATKKSTYKEQILLAPMLEI